MFEHVSEAELLLAFDGELPAERDAIVRSHRSSCRECEEKWVRLAGLSNGIAAVQCPPIEFRPEETAVARLVARIDHARRKESRPEKITLLGSRWFAWANTLAAVAVAVTCIVWLPSHRAKDHPLAHPAAAYDFDQAVPVGYLSLPYADPALPLDDTTVLPVELTAEDLELMGVEANGDGARAEILLGMDGWPRAIRIVEQY